MISQREGPLHALFVLPKVTKVESGYLKLNLWTPFKGVLQVATNVCGSAVVFHATTSLFLNCVNSPTPNQYNNRNGIPGIKNRNKISNPFGKFI